MFNNKFYGYVINSAIKNKAIADDDEPDFQKTGISGILNYLYSTNPKKKYYGCSKPATVSVRAE